MYSQFVGVAFGWGSESLTDIKYEDYKTNGLYCKSGLAFYNKEKKQAECADAKKITQKNRTLAFPYECDPTDNLEPCKIFYSDTDSFDVPCKCALDGTQKGYCSYILGTPWYAESRVKVKSLLFGNKCHTNDRDNFPSKLDICSTVDMKETQSAIEKDFDVNHWPYI